MQDREIHAGGKPAWRPYVVIGVIYLVVGGIGLLAGLVKGEWTGFSITSAIALSFLAALWRARLQVEPPSIVYQTLFSRREIAYADIADAFFETVRSGFAPQGAAKFFLRLKNGKTLGINLRLFPIETAALLFQHLEARHIPLAAPATWAARRMHDQIQECRRRLAA